MDDRRLHRSRREHRRLPRRSTTGSSSRTCRSSNRNGHGVSPSTRPPSWRRRPIAPRTRTAAGSPTSAGAVRHQSHEAARGSRSHDPTRHGRPSPPPAQGRAALPRGGRRPRVDHRRPGAQALRHAPGRRPRRAVRVHAASTSSSRSTTSSAPACAPPTTSGASPTRRSRTGRQRACATARCSSRRASSSGSACPSRRCGRASRPGCSTRATTSTSTAA